MRAESAARTEIKRRLRKSEADSSRSVRLRIAEHPTSDRLQRLVELAISTLREAETLARDKAFTDASMTLQTFDPKRGIDFYREVERFETGLIKIALEQTAGNQARAADLLQLKPTTLNSKIKLYHIEY